MSRSALPTSLDLLAEFDPETLCIRVVEVDELREKEDDAGTPEH
jgi:hypothetical protein